MNDVYSNLFKSVSHGSESQNSYGNDLDRLIKIIKEVKMDDNVRDDLCKRLLSLKNEKINLMLAGCTGSGKSSTINALFEVEKATVGVGVSSETMEITRYDLGNLFIWDTPGLGQGIDADKEHKKKIVNLLNKKDQSGHLLIDLVLVIVDGASKNLGTAYDLINNVIIPNLGNQPEKRILVAINKADAAMSPKHWNWDKHCPNDQTLIDYLEAKARDVHDRIKESTGVDTTPIYYSAGYKEEGEEQEPSYNLSKLLLYILKFTPERKRLVYANTINSDDSFFIADDGKQDYLNDIKNTFSAVYRRVVEECGCKGAEVGKIFGKIGEAVGRAGGKLVGGLIGIVVAATNCR